MSVLQSLVWHDDRYESKILRGTSPIPVYEYKVKVTDLERYFKFLQSQFLQSFWWIYFFGMMMDSCPKYYAVPSSPQA